MRAAIARVDVRGTAQGAGVALLSVAAGTTIVHQPALVRPLVAAAFGGLLLVGSVVRVDATIVATFALLPLLALGRRLLISSAGWSSTDPLLLVAPILALFLVLRLLVLERRPVAADRLSKLVIAFIALLVVETANPDSGGVKAGAAGVLFVVGPMLWFFVGRELVDERMLRLVLGVSVVLAVAISVYGLAQAEIGFPWWDRSWIASTGYTGLNVGGKVRGFGTFPSAQEYATYLGLTAVVAVAFALRRRVAWLVAVPLLLTAMFLASARAILITSAFALIVIAGVRTRRRRAAAVTVAVAVAAVGAAVHVYGPSLEARAASTGNPLVTHQVLGVTDPLNPQHSTFLLHYNEIVYGVSSGLRAPIGHGTAVISLGGARFGATASTTEFDVSNAFIAGGLVGGALFLAVVVLVFWRAVSLCFRRHGTLAIAVLGVLIVTAGQWLNGAMYTVTPLVWLTVGWLVAETARQHLQAGEVA